MAKIDRIYHDLLTDILENGYQKEDRTGTGTISVFGRQLRYDMRQGFPLLTTKRLHTKSIFHELLWFLSGDTNIRQLNRNGVTIWNEWPYKKYCQYCDEHGLQAMDEKEFTNKIIEDKDFADRFGDLGPVYGKQWLNWQANKNCNCSQLKKISINQIQQALDKLKTKPDDRRILVSAWNPAEIEDMGLPPCHYAFQIYTRDLTISERLDLVSKTYASFHRTDFKDCLELDHETIDSLYPVPRKAISLMWNQRSVDTFLGLPFNIASYAALLMMFAQQVDMMPHELICNLGDTHIYSNHLDYVRQQLERDVDRYAAPELKLNRANDIFCYQFQDFELIGYESYPNWKNVPIAV